jgi:hypothetical protein
MILEWFDAKKAKEMGESLALYFIKNIPLTERVDEKEFMRKTKKILEALAIQVSEFKKTTKLNMYKRAQLGNTFKWTLKNAGFSDAYINELTIWLVKNI